MKLISWNVNGLRACLTHGFAESFAALDADIFSVQETKMQPGQADFAPDGYTEYTYSAEKKGYSGTACWCREQPLSVTTGIGIEQHDHEGRVLTLEYPGFWLVNCYTPNSQDGLKRLDYRMEWEEHQDRSGRLNYLPKQQCPVPFCMVQGILISTRWIISFKYHISEREYAFFILLLSSNSTLSSVSAARALTSAARASLASWRRAARRTGSVSASCFASY